MTSSVSMAGEVELADWRRQVCELYASVRQSPDPQLAHLPWRSGRDRLFQEHSQSPLSPEDPLRAGLRYAAYDPALRWQLAVQYATSDQRPATSEPGSRPAPEKGRTCDSSGTSTFRPRSTPASVCGGLNSTAVGCSSRSATGPPEAPATAAAAT